jgi:hypothetical protein
MEGYCAIDMENDEETLNSCCYSKKISRLASTFYGSYVLSSFTFAVSSLIYLISAVITFQQDSSYLNVMSVFGNVLYFTGYLCYMYECSQASDGPHMAPFIARPAHRHTEMW